MVDSNRECNHTLSYDVVVTYCILGPSEVKKSNTEIKVNSYPKVDTLPYLDALPYPSFLQAKSAS